MAFRQPQHRPQTSRQLSFPEPSEQEQRLPIASSPRKRSLEESEEWVLFSPSAAPSTTKTHTTSTERTRRTAVLSRLSDFGSLDTAAHSDQIDEEDDENITEHGSEPDDEAELDSLDDGLHAFREPSEVSSPRPRLDHSEGVFPTHDGFGTFGDSSAAIHQQLWQFERLQKRKQRRRTSSVQRTLDALDRMDEPSQESERIRRIEQWRLEQSRALLEEIERETRRMRRMSRVSASRSRADSLVPQTQTKSETAFSTTSIDAPPLSEALQPVVEQIEQTERQPSEEETKSFWQKFTERVIRDLIGIDENLLSIILGEDLSAECQAPPSSGEAPKADIAHAISFEDRDVDIPIEEAWQHRLLARIARELGILVHQLSEHPGAFSTYLRTHETPSYAGLPGTSTPTAPMLNSAELGTSSNHAHQSGTSPSGAFFQPTVHHSDASLWGIDEEDEPEAHAPLHPSLPTAAALQAEREYWEKELDIKMVFTFLKSRFSSRPPSPSPADDPASPSYPYPTDDRRPSANATFATSARRAALIRQHHPLTSTFRPAGPGSGPAHGPERRRESAHYAAQRHAHPHYATATATAAPLMRRIGHAHHTRTKSSSCASQSTRKSKRSAGGSSRNYWDIGGSGSLVGSASGVVGVWGEA